MRIWVPVDAAARALGADEVADAVRREAAARGVEVTLIRARRIPWSEVRGFERGSGLRGGLRVLTPTGKVWSPAPSSWWGGPAPAELIAELESARPTRRSRQKGAGSRGKGERARPRSD